MDTAHKEKLLKVPNANADKEHAVDIEIYGMTGIPEADLLAHEEKILGAGASAAKRANTGNVSPGNFTPMPMMPMFPAGIPQYYPQMHPYPMAPPPGSYMPQYPVSAQSNSAVNGMMPSSLYPVHPVVEPTPVVSPPEVSTNHGPVISSAGTVAPPETVTKEPTVRLVYADNELSIVSNFILYLVGVAN